MIKDFTTYINEGLFDRNQSEFTIRKTDRGVEQVYIPSTKDDLYKYINIAIEQAKKERTYPDVNLNNIDISELGNVELEGLFSEDAYTINPDISNWDIKSIPSKFFDNNKQIKEFIIPDSVTSIGNGVFWGCTSMTSVTIPNSVTRIGEDAFWGCDGLTSVTIPNSVTRIGEDVFRGCSGLTSIVVESGNTAYDSRNGCNAIIETATNTLVVGCQSTIIPNSVMSIGSSAFAYCSSLTSVTIPNSVTSIGSSAFYGCSSLNSVTIPNSVTSIGDYAFFWCSDLKYVTISKHCNIMLKSFPRDCKIIRK